MPQNLIIIGAGQMGSAIVKGLAKTKFCAATNIYLYDLDTEKLRKLNREFGFGIINTIKDIEAIVSNDSIILFAVKPQNIDNLLEEIKSFNIPVNALLISILAGTKISKFEKYFPNNPIIRSMPNTPAQISKGATAISANDKCSKEQSEIAKAIFNTLGITVEVKEENLDAVTALSGSGPAYIFLLTEAMTEAGIKLGLSEASAKALARQTVCGAACLMSESGEEVSTLRERVTSPNGTTHAALENFKSNNFKDIVYKALEAAFKRSEELS
jgi:pyrroline-5-carboxylate reductase